MPLFFPGSEANDEDKDPNELVFRDGKRTVAPYLAVLLGQLDTERYTFQEAVDTINADLINDHVGRVFDHTVAEHIRTWSR